MNNNEIFNQEVKFDWQQDNHPCWYANLNKTKSRLLAAWVVGVKHTAGCVEHTINISELGDVDNDAFWLHATSLDYATKIIEQLKTNSIFNIEELKTKMRAV